MPKNGEWKLVRQTLSRQPAQSSSPQRIISLVWWKDRWRETNTIQISVVCKDQHWLGQRALQEYLAGLVKDLGRGGRYLGAYKRVLWMRTLKQPL